MLQQRCYAFKQHRLVQSISNQSHVSTTLATHLLSNKHDSNVVFSPLSIQTLLSLLAAGSKDQTLDQLLTFLKADTTDNLKSLYSQLVSSILADGSPTGGPKLSFANAVWVHKTLTLKPSFKQVVDTVYKGVCEQADFKEAVEVAREVNSWAKKETNGLIKEVITAKEGKNGVKNGTMIILANAIYFKGTWSQQFNTSLTKERDFHLLNGNKVKVPFMTSSKNQFVREYDGFKVLGLPYAQGQDKRNFTMYCYLSDAKDGLPSLVKKMSSTSDFFERHTPRVKEKVGEFFIPKFKIEFGFKASGMLKELGLVLPFGVGHHVTEMVDSPVGTGLYVPEIHQTSVVEVNEEGTEAAAVSFGEMAFGCAATVPKVVDFVADHPFLFVIREDVTGVVLFMGQVIDPSLSI
ncbi:serpin-ZX-like isoform X2 [Helianthus annuus]|uniref:serpin-ZX-like isoform X2 n=1 Tax=Helianthus annuus TaxID=4232 RepID=UPI0016531246|nr:serpin-ZX-like isoform X2 [Helianthus annuus]